jgi:hypothetical protein
VGIHGEPSELMDDGSSVCTLFSVMNHVCDVADISLEGQTLRLTFVVLIRKARWKDEVNLVIRPMKEMKRPKLDMKLDTIGSSRSAT